MDLRLGAAESQRNALTEVDRIGSMPQSIGLAIGLGLCALEKSPPHCRRRCADSIARSELGAGCGRLAHDRTDGSWRYGFSQLGAGAERQSADRAGTGRVQSSRGIAAGRTVCRDARSGTFLLRQRNSSSEHGMVLLPRPQRTVCRQQKSFTRRPVRQGTGRRLRRSGQQERLQPEQVGGFLQANNRFLPSVGMTNQISEWIPLVGMEGISE